MKPKPYFEASADTHDGIDSTFSVLFMQALEDDRAKEYDVIAYNSSPTTLQPYNPMTL